MASTRTYILSFLVVLISVLMLAPRQDNVERKVYIVITGDKYLRMGNASSSAYMSMLKKVRGSVVKTDALLHVYRRSFSGFAAKLTEAEAEKIKGLDGVASVFLSQKNEIQTTQSWDFMGFPQTVPRVPAAESDIIIGVIDSGIWPNHPSFSDQGLGPPPSKWKGTCTSGCNNKIIGAMYFKADGQYDPADDRSAIDTNGHGTHVASTAAGVPVVQASLLGTYAIGTARGGVPSARIAVYKVCWVKGCEDADILAAFDNAISDGVDIISASLGNVAREYYEDPIAYAAYRAMSRGILTSFAAGNTGPNLRSIINFSPWSLSVAATTMNRKYSTSVRLGNGQAFVGLSINAFSDFNGYLVYAGDAPATTNSTASYCTSNSLNPNLVQGKIVLCEGGETTDTNEPFRVGATGAIFGGVITQEDNPKIFPLRACMVTTADGTSIYNYIRLVGAAATATIFGSVEAGDSTAPTAASFSARGPNPLRYDILKPDLTAPGVNILAAWPPTIPISGVAGDQRFSNFNIQSGTSMACPHVSAIAAYIKSFHPTWSPAALRSALMTTARQMDATASYGAEFAYGAGFMAPLEAVKPGLVYDLDESDYIKYLCGQGYTQTQILIITGQSIICTAANSIPYWNLNYPTLTAASSTPNVDIIFTRTMTNVGSATSVYRYTVVAPPGLSIAVTPDVLRFTSLGEKRAYGLKVTGVVNMFASTSLVWSDGTFQVRSPIVIYVP